jgi:N-carbamoylputrescine amidase
MRKVKAALIQMNLKGDPAADSIEAIRDTMIAAHMPLIEEAARQGVQVLGLQEVFSAPYFPATIDDRWFESAEAVPDGPTTRAMCEAAKKHGMVIVSPVYERDRSGRRYNTAAVIDADGEYLGKFRKIHIPKIGKYDEKYYFADGDLGYPVFDTAIGKVGVYICYDRHFPEGWRELAMNGAEVIFNPSATVRGLSDHLWTLEQPAAAVANCVYIGANNRVGMEPPWNNGHFYGSSYFVNPRGEILTQGPDDQDALVTADLDLAMIGEVREGWKFYRERRPDTYGAVASWQV